MKMISNSTKKRGWAKPTLKEVKLNRNFPFNKIIMLTAQINVYAPNVSSALSDMNRFEKFWEEVESLANKYGDLGAEVIIGGDCNTILDKSLDAKGPNVATNKRCIGYLKETMNRLDLKDVIRIHHQYKFLPTYAPIRKKEPKRYL